MEILITGASGFIGTHLIKELLAIGTDPICYVRNEGSEKLLRQIGIKRFCRDIADMPKVDGH